MKWSSQLSKIERGLNLGGGERAGDVLLIGVDEERGGRESLLLEQGSKLDEGGVEGGRMGGVDDPDDGVRVGIVILPVRTQGALTPNVPDREGVVLVTVRADVEA